MYLINNNQWIWIIGLITCVCVKLEAANPANPTVLVTIPALVRISGLNSITLVPSNFTSAITGATTACIYTNIISPLGSYFVRATSLNASAGVFRVKNGTNFINYSAFWNPAAAPTQTVALVSGTKTIQQSGGNSTSLTCGGNPNANFNVSFSIAQIVAKPPGVYSDTVTLLISPS